MTADIVLHLESEDYKGQVVSELKKLAKKASLPGFRPGKVPVQVVRKMYGTSVVIEEINKLVSQSLQNYIEENELDILGDPIPQGQKSEEDFDPEGNKDMEFVFEVGLAPSFEVDLNLPELPPYYEVEIDGKFLEKELNIYREHFGETSNPEEYKKGDIVFGKVFEVDEKGEAIEGGFEKMLPLNPKRVENEEVFKPFEGAKLEDIFDFDTSIIGEDKRSLKNTLFIEEDEAEQMLDKKLKIQVKRLNRVEKAEMDEVFFKKVLENLKINVEEEDELSEELIKEKMGKNLKGDFQEIAKNRFKNKLVEALIDHHPLEFPDEFLQKWLLKTGEEEKTEESVKEEYPKFTKDLTYTLIEGKLISKYDIKLEEEEVDKTLRKNLRQSLAMSGMPADDQMLESYLQYARQDQNTMNRMVRTSLTEKVTDRLAEEFSPKKTPIDASTFMDKTKKEDEDQ